jgi:predicted RNA-binding protein with TRAM domain
VNYLERDFNRNRERRGPRNFNRGPETPKPFKIGDVIDLNIESIGEKGDGVGKINGFVVFVKEVKQGDNVRVKITNIMRKFAVGEKTDEEVNVKIEQKSNENEESEESEEMISQEEDLDNDDFSDEEEDEIEEKLE